MKYRTDYVTNSSSSSFIIAKKNLDEDQIFAIKNHHAVAKRLGLFNNDMPWNIDENDDYIGGHIYIDNFSMSEFLSIIGVENRDILWDESGTSMIDRLSDDNPIPDGFNKDMRRSVPWIRAVDDIRNGVEYDDSEYKELEELIESLDDEY